MGVASSSSSSFSPAVWVGILPSSLSILCLSPSLLRSLSRVCASILALAVSKGGEERGGRVWRRSTAGESAPAGDRAHVRRDSFKKRFEEQKIFPCRYRTLQI